jgi:serine/threonine protein kinase
LSGGTLKDAIAQGMNHERVVDLMRQIVSALHAIHSLGLVYRDLKPENMMFRHTGELVLVDFGIVKSVRDDAKGLVETHHGQIIGTPYYVSPEQATGREVTNRSDFYCLGVVLYEMLTRDKPYRADSLDMLLARHMYAAVPELPPEHAVFQPLLSKLMAKSPDDRPSDAQAIWTNLDIMSGRRSGFGDLPTIKT